MKLGQTWVLLWVALFLAALPSAGQAQRCPSALEGAWTARLPVAEGFLLRLSVRQADDGRYEAEIRSKSWADSVPTRMDGDRIRFQSAVFPVAFDGTWSADRELLGGFVQYASHLTRIRLARETATPTWSGEWTPLGVPAGDLRLDLYIGDDGEGGQGGYFFFRDQRLTSLWGYGLSCAEGGVRLGEKNLGLWFEGVLESETDTLRLTMTGPAGAFPVAFRRLAEGEEPEQPDAPEAPARMPADAPYQGSAPSRLNDGWRTASPAKVGIDPGRIGELVRAVADEELAYVHGVLVARHGQLAVDEYFYGFDHETLHDMRSASKTVTSTLVGLAVKADRISGSDARALDYFPNYRRYANWDARKADIRVRDLLTMSSGLDANDSDFGSAASESRYQSQTARPDWIKLALDAPMIFDPGSRILYGGANPMILGGVLANAVHEPVEWFAHRTLFGPLGVESYRWFLTPTGIPYMGGGLWMRPRDMLKYGQLYLDGGVWQGERILDEAWIEESWERYGRLEPLDINGHPYGYLWWHHSYQVDGRTVETLEARGNGGQYIFVVPSLDMVVVITSGNFRNRLTREPEDILRRFILPAALPDASTR